MDNIISLSEVEMIRENKVILSDINLSINKGDFLAITGPNGGGKTTLLRIILKLLKPSSGSISYFTNGKEVERLSIGYLPQKNRIDPKFPITVRQVISSGLMGVRNINKNVLNEETDRILKVVELENKANSPIGALSGGQLQRTLLGRAIIAPHDVLVLDEPLSYIDKKFEDKIYNIISGLAKDTTVLLVSHEMTKFAEMANRHLIVDHSITQCHSASHLIHCDCC
ncbi:MAG: ATP-binding cassette domain-containing protein [Paramuribaculum sp.]|nr:ATP-binding cassette domain-containing protein [Paramuribaculum sp.]